MLYALGSPRAFDSADGDPWHGRLHGMVVDAGLKTPPLAVWLESQVHALAVRARHW